MILILRLLTHITPPEVVVLGVHHRMPCPTKKNILRKVHQLGSTQIIETHMEI